jgi:hypothetical protein
MLMKSISIKSKTDYNSAADRLETLTNAKPGSPQAQELKLLVKAIADYHRNQR